MKEVILVRYGEVHLKGLNRPYFMKELMRHIRLAIKPVGGTAQMSEGRIFVRDTADIADAVYRVSRVFGVHSVSVAFEMEKDIDAITKKAVEMIRDKKGTFKVEARRSDKRFPMDSPKICAHIGGHIVENIGLAVDLRHPENTLTVEIREMAYLYLDEVAAVGGMPMGTNGKAMLLLSGGIDSPVAGYQVARRGVCISCVHFHSPPYTSERAKEKVLELAGILSSYCGGITVHIVPFTNIQMALYNGGAGDLLTVLMRRFMMRIAQRLAQDTGCQALITGESIGQVASQTMEALAATDAVSDLPVFRPLIGSDKLTITEYAKEIGTYETSIKPYEDCCTVFTPRHPTTHPKMSNVLRAEEGLPIDDMINEAIEGTETLVI